MPYHLGAGAGEPPIVSQEVPGVEGFTDALVTVVMVDHLKYTFISTFLKRY